MIGLDDNFSSPTTLEPQPTTPPSPKPATPSTHHIPSPPSSTIPSTPSPTTTTPAHHSHALHQVLVLLVSLILPQFLQLFQTMSSTNSKIFSPSFTPSKMKFVSLLHPLLTSSLKWKHIQALSWIHWRCRPNMWTKKNLLPDPSHYYLFLVLVHQTKKQFYFGFRSTILSTVL